jgi:hypothetical protein
MNIYISKKSPSTEGIEFRKNSYGSLNIRMEKANSLSTLNVVKIADQVRNDNGIRNDSTGRVRNDSTDQVRNDTGIADQVRNDSTDRVHNDKGVHNDLTTLINLGNPEHLNKIMVQTIPVQTII